MASRSRKLLLAIFAVLGASFTLWVIWGRKTIPVDHPSASGRPPAKKQLFVDASAAGSNVLRVPSAEPQAVTDTSSVARLLPSSVTPIIAESPAVTHQVSPEATVSAAASRPDPSDSSSKESRATAQMYAAHVSLRDAEVADPNSEANRKILHTMVTKSLSVAPTPPPRGN